MVTQCTNDDKMMNTMVRLLNDLTGKKGPEDTFKRE